MLCLSIYLFHLNDSENLPLDQQHVTQSRVFPGDGIAHPEDWVKAAIQSGFDGYFSLEMFRQDIWDLTPEQAAGLCRDKLIQFAESNGL